MIQTLDLITEKLEPATTVDRQIVALETVLACLKFNHREFGTVGTMFAGVDTPLRINRNVLEAKLRELKHEPEPLPAQSATLDLRTDFQKSQDGAAPLPAGNSMRGTSLCFGERRDVNLGLR